MTRRQSSFGRLLREKRLEKKLSLRKFAELVGVSPTYLSQVEQEHVMPPTADRVKRMAELRQGDCRGAPHEVIDPRDTRKAISWGLELARHKKVERPEKRRGIIPV